eukprot:scaffold10428_cov58-Skeletonema_marinoi.AAC.1
MSIHIPRELEGGDEQPVVMEVVEELRVLVLRDEIVIEMVTTLKVLAMWIPLVLIFRKSCTSYE